MSTESDVPTIAGFSAAYLDESLTYYKKKERHCPEAKYHSGDKKGQKTDMCSVAKDLSDADIKQLAQHYAGKKFVRAQQKFDPAVAKKGEALHERSREKCHSEKGSVAKDDSGILAGQWMPYLQDALADFKTGKRSIDKKMKPKIEKLEKADFDALVNHCGSFQSGLTESVARVIKTRIRMGQGDRVCVGSGETKKGGFKLINSTLLAEQEASCGSIGAS